MPKKDEVKALEHELGRRDKKIEDQSRQLKESRRMLARAMEGARQTGQLVDAVLTAVTLSYGQDAMDPDCPQTQLGKRLVIPKFDAAELLNSYEIHARRDGDGSYVIGVVERSKRQEA